MYDIDRWSQDLNAKFTVRDCFFGNVKITKSTDCSKYVYSQYQI